MEQTTTQTEYIDRLLARIDDHKARIQSLRMKINFLEQRLKQRFEETKKDFKKLEPYFESMRSKIYAIFLELPPTTGLSHEEIALEFRRLYPTISTVNLQRRTRELVSDEKKLWSKKDEQGTVRFYLRLKDMKVVEAQ